MVATNRKAKRDYEILETYEAGIVLKGTEIKSIREGAVDISDAYARVDSSEEMWLYNMHVAPYKHGGIFNHEPKRPRKLLLHKSEIKRLIGKTQIRGYTLVPLEVYINERGLAKVKLALVKGSAVEVKKLEGETPTEWNWKEGFDEKLSQRLKDIGETGRGEQYLKQTPAPPGGDLY